MSNDWLLVTRLLKLANHILRSFLSRKFVLGRPSNNAQDFTINNSDLAYCFKGEGS